MPTILERIVARKHAEVAAEKARNDDQTLHHAIQSAEPPRGFYRALKRRVDAAQPAVIAEIKKASPSKGVICENLDPVRCAQSYLAGGAACLSVLTDRDFFQGHDEYLQAARAAVTLPVLRKDFIVDVWQIAQSRALGADCVLLIAAVLDDETLRRCYDAACALGMDALIEVHNAHELQRALRLDAPMIGINNRNLNTFVTTLETTRELAAQVPADRLVISESGIHSRAHIHQLAEWGIHAYLIGEAFMRHDDPGQKLFSLVHC